MTSKQDSIAKAMEATMAKAAAAKAKAEAKKAKALEKKATCGGGGPSQAELHAIGIQKKADEKYAEEIAELSKNEKWTRTNFKSKEADWHTDSRGRKWFIHPSPQYGGSNNMEFMRGFGDSALTAHEARYGKGNLNGFQAPTFKL